MSDAHDIELFDFEQGTPEWHEVRLGLVTGTCCDSLITPVKGEIVKGKARTTLIATLIDEIVRPEAERGFEGNKHTERGKELEPDALAWYCNINRVEGRRVGFILNRTIGLGVSPDLLIGEKGGVEAKAPDGKTHVQYLMGGVLPDEYKTQVHACLAATQRAWWDFISWCPGYEPFVVRTVRNQYTELLEIALKDFHKDFAGWKAKIIGN
jgi:hypothetical protein